MFIRRTENNWLTKWWLGVDKVVLFCVFTLIVFGVLIQFSASPYQARRMGLHDEYNFIKNIGVYFWIGISSMLVSSLFKLEHIRKIGIAGFLGFVFLVFLTFFSARTKGATRWINLGFMKIQPSEFLKPFFAIVIAMILVRIKDFSKKIKTEKVIEKIKDFKRRKKNYILFLIGLLTTVCALLLLQPDVGMTITFFVIFLAEVFVAGISLFIIGGLIIVGILGLLVLYAFFPHFTHRINQFLNDDNYQLAKALDAIKESNFLFGGHANNLKTVVPDIHTDFIFTAVIEEIGPVLSSLVIVVFLVLILHILYRLKMKNDNFVVLSGIGIISYIAFQIMYNLSMSLGMGPTKGMTLPFISYGGSSFISSCFAIGIILSLLQDQNLRR
ncbi:MAG: FtsW/RodA/SpoVE family cell cycle protein [bacterium]|nr:FtsW/RodA/SpoVE family cell cycle protein [bacterium]